MGNISIRRTLKTKEIFREIDIGDCR